MRRSQLFASLLCLLAPTFAVAATQVGDVATYKYKQGGVVTVMKKEVLTLDERLGLFVRTTTTNTDGSYIVEGAWFAPKMANAEELVAECARRGTLEALTVKAGEFNGCYGNSSFGTKAFFSTEVPFDGLVESHFNNGSIELIELFRGR